MRKASASPNQRFVPNNINKCSDVVAGTLEFFLEFLSGHLE